MKKIFLIIGVSLILGACNNSNHQEGGADITDHSTQHGAAEDTGTQTSIHSMDTLDSNGKSMMSIMHGNMNQMKAMASTGNPDKDFAAMMKVHHMGALEMAQLEIASGTDAGLKQMAQKMIDAQEKEISELNTFISGHNTQGGNTSFHKEAINQMNSMKMDMDHSGSIDKQFAQMMIPHHQGGIDMAKAYLKSRPKEEKLQTMAKKIMADQQQEIEELRAWLNRTNK